MCISKSIFSFAPLLLVANFSAAEGTNEEESRYSNNWKTLSALQSAPVSAFSYGIRILDDSLRGSQELYFKNIKQPNEHAMLQAFLVWLDEPEIAPAIMIRGTLFTFEDRANRSSHRASEDCQNMLDELARIPPIYLDKDNSIFNNLWLEDAISPEYGEIDHLDVQGMIYLKAKIKHSGSDDYMSCERYF